LKPLPKRSHAQLRLRRRISPGLIVIDLYRHGTSARQPNTPPVEKIADEATQRSKTDRRSLFQVWPYFGL